MTSRPIDRRIPQDAPPEEAERLLRQWASAALAGSYAPYSQFPVGAAVLAGSGKVYLGANIENASYGLSMCAERVAVFTAAAAGERVLAAAAVAAETGSAAPCGACRQVLSEFMGGAAPVYLVLDGQNSMLRVADLLPHAFGPGDLPQATRHVS